MLLYRPIQLNPKKEMTNSSSLTYLQYEVVINQHANDMVNSIPDAWSSLFVEEESDGVELLSGEEGVEGDNTNIRSADSVIFFAPKV